MNQPLIVEILAEVRPTVDVAQRLRDFQQKGSF